MQTKAKLWNEFVAGGRTLGPDGSITLRGRLGAASQPYWILGLLAIAPARGLGLLNLVVLAMLVLTWLVVFRLRLTVRLDRARRQVTVSRSTLLGRDEVEWALPFSSIQDARLVACGPGPAPAPLRALVVTTSHDERCVILVDDAYANLGLQEEVRAVLARAPALSAGA